MDSRRHFSRQAENRQVVFGQTHQHFIVALDFRSAGNLLCSHRQIEVSGEERVGGLAVIELVVVGSRVTILVPSEGRLRSVQSEEGLDIGIDVRLDQVSAETTIVLRVVDEEGGARGAQGGEDRVIESRVKVGGIFLNFIRVHRVGEVRFERAEAGHLDRHLDPLVERAQNDGLPAAPG